MDLELSDDPEIWQVSEIHSCWNVCEISEQYDYFNTHFHGFEASKDLVALRFMGRLTHCGLVTPMAPGILVNSGSCNGLFFVSYQCIT